MWSRRVHRLAVLAAIFGLTASLAVFAQNSSRRGRKYKAPPPTSRVEVTILRYDDGKPIENAAVIYHLEGDKGNMELKTNEDGKSVIDVLPTGSKVLLQVIAKGYKTYGQEYDLDKPELKIAVKLKRPGQQYSIYDNHDQAADAGNGAGKSANPGKDATAKDATAKDASSKPAANQPQPQ